MNGVNSNLANALRGPIIMITVGVLFLLDRFVGLHFGETWPLILIVLGVLALGGAGRKRNAGVAGVPPEYPMNYAAGNPPQYPPQYPAQYPTQYPQGYAPNVPPAGGAPPNPPPPGARR